jgi:Cdc6-like AAA superfamily ATPase
MQEVQQLEQAEQILIHYLQELDFLPQHQDQVMLELVLMVVLADQILEFMGVEVPVVAQDFHQADMSEAMVVLAEQGLCML